MVLSMAHDAFCPQHVPNLQRPTPTNPQPEHVLSVIPMAATSSAFVDTSPSATTEWGPLPAGRPGRGQCDLVKIDRSRKLHLEYVSQQQIPALDPGR